MEVSVRQFEVLNTAHSFQLKLLQSVLGHEVPVPERIEQLRTLPLADANLQIFREWLALLDLAITPLSLRDAFKNPVEHATAEALLCHYAWKRSTSGTNRDKADFVVTHLYRHPASNDWDISADLEQTLASVQNFEFYLLKLIDQEPPLPEEHRHLAKEFEFFAAEADDFRSFEEMLDSGIMQRVREVKQSLGASFYHPRVLAGSAAYNCFFRQCFDRLFRSATKSIKTYAEKVQMEGGSVMSRVDGNVTVKQLTDLEETTILEAEYQRAMEYFHRVSRYKKAVDSRRGRAADAPRPTSDVSAADPGHPGSARPHSASVSATVEESRIQAMEESIGHYICAAGDQTLVQAVPLRNSNLGLRPTEVEAFKVNYLHEKSFRGDYARLLIRVVALLARIQSELEEFRGKQSSSYLWKPHADSLSYLVRAAEVSQTRAEELISLARQRGLADKTSSIQASLQRLTEATEAVNRTLSTSGAAGT